MCEAVNWKGCTDAEEGMCVQCSDLGKSVRAVNGEWCEGRKECEEMMRGGGVQGVRAGEGSGV